MKTILKGFVLPLVGVAAALPVARADGGCFEWVTLEQSNPPSASTPDNGFVHPYHAPPSAPDGGFNPNIEMRTFAFLGVETAPVTRTLTDQLGLPDDTGLVVVQVLPDSPAAAALKPDDILLKLDDQWLIESRQFAVLVRNHKVGDEVTLTYVRRGQQATATLKLAQHRMPRFLPERMGEERPDFGPHFPLFQPGRGEVPPWVEPFQPGKDSFLDPEDRDMILRARDLLQPLGSGEAPANPETATGTIQYKDSDYTLQLAIESGKKSLVASDAAGKQVFSGPVDTPDQRKTLPPAVRERLDRIEAMNALGDQAVPDFKSEKRVYRPAGEGIAAPGPPRAADRATEL